MSTTKAVQWTKQNGNIPYYETSAKEGTNVNEAFEQIARDALKAQSSQMYKILVYVYIYRYIPDTLPEKKFRLNPTAQTKKKGCCQ